MRYFSTIQSIQIYFTQDMYTCLLLFSRYIGCPVILVNYEYCQDLVVYDKSALYSSTINMHRMTVCSIFRTASLYVAHRSKTE